MPLPIASPCSRINPRPAFLAGRSHAQGPSALRLAGLQPAVFLAPPVVRLCDHAELPSRFRDFRPSASWSFRSDMGQRTGRCRAVLGRVPRHPTLRRLRSPYWLKPPACRGEPGPGHPAVCGQILVLRQGGQHEMTKCIEGPYGNRRVAARRA